MRSDPSLPEFQIPALWLYIMFPAIFYKRCLLFHRFYFSRRTDALWFSIKNFLNILCMYDSWPWLFDPSTGILEGVAWDPEMPFFCESRREMNPEHHECLEKLKKKKGI